MCYHDDCHGDPTLGPFFHDELGPYYRCDTEKHLLVECSTTGDLFPPDMVRGGDCCDECPRMIAARMGEDDLPLSEAA